MGWLSKLRDGLRYHPQTTVPVARPATTLDPALRAWVDAAFGAGPDAAAKEKEALERLREASERAQASIERAYTESREDEYSLRWALVYAAGQLQAAAAVPFLDRVAREPQGRERSRDLHHFSTVAEDTSRHCRAVAGLAAIAAGGDATALAALVAQLGNASYAVRATTVLELRALSGQPVSDAEIRERLGSDAEEIMAIRRVAVRELVPAEQQRKESDLAPPPDSDESAARQSQTSFGKSRPPRIGR